MKKLLFLALLFALTGCAAPQPEAEAVVEAIAAVPADPHCYMGLAAVANIAKSMHATYDFPGYAQTEMTFAAVVVDGSGVIRACAIDGISAVIPFDATGALQVENGAVFRSKTALGQGYGMHKASPLGTEWHQQAADFAAHCVGKTAAEVRGGDTVTSVTIATDSLRSAVLSAAENAHTAVAPDSALTLVCRAVMEDSRSACIDDGSPGLAEVRAAALVRASDGAEVSCALISRLPFSAHGRITCDISQRLSLLSDVLYPTAAAAAELSTLRYAAENG